MNKSKKIDWLNHFLEFVVVIIGILIAFQLNTCSVEKKQGEILDKHIANIIDETEFNNRRIKEEIGESQILLNNIDSLISSIKQQKDIRSINGLSLQILKFNNTYIKKNAYNALVESGDIRFFKDFKTKDEIIQLYEYYRWAEGISEAALQNYVTYYYPYVVENLDMVSGQPQDIAVYSNKKFLNILATYSYMMKNRLEKQKELAQKTGNFLEKYQQE